MSKKFLVTLMFLAFALGIGCAPSPKVETPAPLTRQGKGNTISAETYNQLIKNSNTIKTVIAEATGYKIINGIRQNINLKLWYQSPDKYYAEISHATMKRQLFRMVHISNGKQVWVVFPKEQSTGVINTAKLPQDIKNIFIFQVNNIGIKFNLVGDRERIKQLDFSENKAGAQAGVPIYTLKFDNYMYRKLPPDMPTTINNAAYEVVTLSALDGLIYKDTFYDDKGSVLQYMEYKNIEKNVDIPPTKFEYAPPKEYKVEDITAKLIKAFREPQPAVQPGAKPGAQPAVKPAAQPAVKPAAQPAVKPAISPGIKSQTLPAPKATVAPGPAIKKLEPVKNPSK